MQKRGLDYKIWLHFGGAFAVRALPAQMVGSNILQPVCACCFALL